MHTLVPSLGATLLLHDYPSAFEKPDPLAIWAIAHTAPAWDVVVTVGK